MAAARQTHRAYPLAAGLLALFLLLVLQLASDGRATAAAARQVTVMQLTVEGAIGPATMDYVQRGIARAEEAGAEALVLTLDTPGGLMASTRELIQSMLSARVPIVAYVAPQGARAASAGTYIVYASHVAAMAPATQLGSATPVQLGGLPGLPDNANPPDPEPDGGTAPQATSGKQAASAMEKKVLEDAVTFIRELADLNGRNADWAERAVRDASNLGAAEALGLGVIDLVASDTADLLRQLDGRVVRTAFGERTLATQNAVLVRLDPDWRTRLLSVITDPNIAYFLMLLGFYGLIFELANPGSLVPGVIGATCLLLALFAFQVLSVNYAGLALIFLGLAFIVGEAFIPSFGVLGIGGLIAFVAGSVILMDGSNQAVSLPAVGGTALLAAGLLLWMITRLVGLRRRAPVYGVEQIGREHVVALDTFSAQDGHYVGYARMSGERWHARSEQPVQAGQQLQVTAVDGLTLLVGAAPDPRQ